MFPKWNLTVEVEFTLFTYDFFATCKKLVNLIKLIFMFILPFPHLFSGVGRIKLLKYEDFPQVETKVLEAFFQSYYAQTG